MKKLYLSLIFAGFFVFAGCAPKQQAEEVTEEPETEVVVEEEVVEETDTIEDGEQN